MTTTKPFSKATAFLGITIDGHIARADGSIDYLPPAPTSPPSTTPSASFKPRVPTITTMLQSSSVLVLGRHSYLTVLSISPWPYGTVPVVVLSTSDPASIPLPTPSNPATPAPTILPSIPAFLNHCTVHSYKNVWVDGGATVRGFLEQGLLDEMVLTTVPVVLGKGISLFASLSREVRCEVVGSEVVEGLVATWYKVAYGKVDWRGRLLSGGETSA